MASWLAGWLEPLALQRLEPACRVLEFCPHLLLSLPEAETLVPSLSHLLLRPPQGPHHMVTLELGRFSEIH
jgi:hypothetical protein